MRLATAADTANALVFRTLGYFALVAFVVTLIRHATSTDRSRRAFGYLAYGVMLPVLIVSSFAVARGSRTDAAFVVLALLSVRTFFIRPARLGTLAALAVVTLFGPHSHPSSSARSGLGGIVICGGCSTPQPDWRCAEWSVGSRQSEDARRGVTSARCEIFATVPSLSAWPHMGAKWRMYSFHTFFGPTNRREILPRNFLLLMAD